MGGLALLHPHKGHRGDIFSTPVKSRRTSDSSFIPDSSPNLTRSEGRKRSPPTGARKNKTKAAMVTDPPAAAVAKSLVMGQVKILKRGEALDELLTVSKDINDRKVTNETATTPPPTKDFVGDRKATRDSRRGKKIADKEKRSLSKSNAKIDDLKIDDFALSSTNRLGPDPEMVPKQMNKNMADIFFAGSAFVDSPPPSSLPLPGFFTKSFVADVNEESNMELRRMLGLSLC